MKRLLVQSAAAIMAADTGALRARIASHGLPMRKDSAPSLEDIAKVQGDLVSAFETFKEKNDERYKQLAGRGEDAVTKAELKSLEAEIAGLRTLRDDLDKLAKRASRPGGDGGAGGAVITPEQKEHREAFLTMLRNPDDEAAKATVQALQRKAVTTTTDAAGGYAVPEMIAAEVSRELSEAYQLRNLVNVVQAGTKDYKELIDRRGSTYGWVGETDTRAETDTPTLAESVPTFGMLYAYPKASEESLDDMFFNVEQWLITSILEGFSEGEENAIINGNGTKKPTGLLNGTPVTTADGSRAYGTLQYVPSGAAAALAADPLITLVQTLKKGYRANATWLMNKATVGDVMTLKDGDGNYLWKMGDIKAGQPDRLMGYAVAESEEMPDVAADAFPIGFGDLKSAYTLVDLVGLRLTRDEITTPGYVKWYARRRLGGAVRKDEAFKLLKVATT